MASLIYNSAIDDIVRGAIDADADSFKAMLVTKGISRYTATFTPPAAPFPNA